MEPRKMLAVVEALASVRTRENIGALAALAATDTKFRALCLPFLFSHVRWPHPDKHDEESGLHFFPESLWPLFKRFDLIWPDDWPDAAPPRWGDRYYVGGDYHPRHTDKLATALPRMPSLIAFSICCPFFPPNSLFNALLTCTSVRELRMTDTPLYISMIPKSPPEFVIERLFLIPVAEAPRVGHGPYEARYSSPALYHSREYRKKYKNDILARYAASAFLFDVGKPTSLTHVQVSGDLCTLDEFAQHDWPRLTSLVMTGHPPRQTGTDLVDVISKMPQLKELRLLFAKSVARGDAMFKVLPAAPEYISAKGNHASLLEQIESLAVSDACQLDRVGYFIAGVERLAILAISDIADPTVAFSKRTLYTMLREISAAGTPAPKTIPSKQQPNKHHHRNNGAKTQSRPFTNTSSNPNSFNFNTINFSDNRRRETKGEEEEEEDEMKKKNRQPEIVFKNRNLKHLRVMLGEIIEPEFCKFLADRFPKLEVLEVEKCGYYDGRNVAPWSAYVDNLKPIRRTLRSLRLGMQFEEQEPLHECSPQKAHLCAPINDDLLLHSTSSSPTTTTPSSANTTHPPRLPPPSTSSSNNRNSNTPTAPWRVVREQCANYFAKHLGQLTRIGFEFRKRPGSYRIDDRWLEWEIERRRVTEEMKQEWIKKREVRIQNVKEERKRERKEEKKREKLRIKIIEGQERERLRERERKEEEERRRRREREREAQVQAQQAAQAEGVGSPGVTRTSTSGTCSSSSPAVITSPATTPSLTTPLSHPASSIHTPTTSAITPSPSTGGGSSITGSFYTAHSGSGGYMMMSPPPMIGDNANTGHRVSSSIGGGQDYFMNFRTSSTYTPPITLPLSSSSTLSPSSMDINSASESTPDISDIHSQPIDLTLPDNITSAAALAAAALLVGDLSDIDSSDDEDANNNNNPDDELIDDEELLWDSEDEDPEGILGIYELRPSWYPFPECWKGRTLWEEEEVADSGVGGESTTGSVTGASVGVGSPGVGVVVNGVGTGEGVGGVSVNGTAATATATAV